MRGIRVSGMTRAPVRKIEGAEGFASSRRELARRTRATRVAGLRGAARAAFVAQLVRAHGARPVLVLVPTAKDGDAFLEDLRARARRARRARAGCAPSRATTRSPTSASRRSPSWSRSAWTCSTAGWRAPRRRPDSRTARPAAASRRRSSWRRGRRSRRACRRASSCARARCTSRSARRSTATRSSRPWSPRATRACRSSRSAASSRCAAASSTSSRRSARARCAIELLGDEVESIREFDPASQRSQAPLAHVVAPPPRELLLDRALRDRALRRRCASSARAAGRSRARDVDELRRRAAARHVPPGAEALAPLLLPRHRDRLRLPARGHAGRDRRSRGRPRAPAALRRGGARELRAARAAAAASSRRPTSSRSPPDALEPALLARRPLLLERLDVAAGDGVEPRSRIALRGARRAAPRRSRARAASERALAPLAARIAAWRAARYRIVLAGAVALARRAPARAARRVRDRGARRDRAARRCWRWSAARARRDARDAALRGLHAAARAARASSPRRRSSGRARSAGGARTAWPDGAARRGARAARARRLPRARRARHRHLPRPRRPRAARRRRRVPAHRVRRAGAPLRARSTGSTWCQRYAGSDGHVPRIDKLGGATWEQGATQACSARCATWRSELLAVHAARELAQGFAFSPRDRALRGVRGDLPVRGDARPARRDRGRARRHAAREADGPARLRRRRLRQDRGRGARRLPRRDGRQAGRRAGADHDPVPAARGDLPQALRRATRCAIEALSRFRTPARARSACSRASPTAQSTSSSARTGCSQKDVRFRDLGLLVVDEEQRFGVAHKERIKQLQEDGRRADAHRHADPAHAADGLRRAARSLGDRHAAGRPARDPHPGLPLLGADRARGDPARDAPRRAGLLRAQPRADDRRDARSCSRAIVPEARVIVAHGQMPERELEERMLRFVHGEADVLLCTTIIESGLDIPRANTILDRPRRHARPRAALPAARPRRPQQPARLRLPAGAAPEQPARPTRASASRRSRTSPSSAAASGSPTSTSRSAARATCSAPSSPGTSPAVGFETYMEMLEETIDELRGVAREAEVDPGDPAAGARAAARGLRRPTVSQRLVLYKRLVEPAATTPRSTASATRSSTATARCPPRPRTCSQVIRLKIQARAPRRRLRSTSRTASSC